MPKKKKKQNEPPSERPERAPGDGGRQDTQRERRVGPTSDVGGPPGIERGVGIETGEETP